MSRPTNFGPWIVRGVITEGRRGNADVFLVGREGAPESFALKTPHGKPSSEPYRRFRDEVDFHSRYQDAGILPMIDGHAPATLDVGEKAWLVMPIAVPFDAALVDAGMTVVVAAIATVAATLARLATLGVHHRDIKPPNLFVCDETNLIGDFGLVSFPEKPEVTGDERHLGPISISRRK